MNALPSFEQQLSRLVSLASVSSATPAWDMGNLAVIEQLAEWFSSLHFSTDILIDPEQSNKANLIATLGHGEGGLVLSGHTDTVPFDEALWRSDPLTATLRDNAYYGIGTADMKGFFAVIIAALRDMDLRQLKHPLIIVATADEESSMSGAKRLAAASLKAPRAAIIGEPTGLRPIRAHKGVMMETIRITGRSGHSSNPALGINALDAMSEVIQALMRYREELATRYRDPLFEIDHPTINLGHIHGGDNPNRICGQCELQFDVRMMPGMAIDSVRQEIMTLISPIVAKHRGQLCYEALVPGVEPFLLDADSALVKAAERMTGLTSGIVGFATEAPFYQTLGIDTIVMGPGSIDVAHQPDEHLPLDHIKPAMTMIQQMVAHYCL
ncbi:MAG TPA: acetylornithine deacetylase [Pseudomonadales bacterium]|nr:acetylornithine deacetylase [Pseudomonadales bacterium]